MGMKELWEQVVEADRIPIPDALKYPTQREYRKSLQQIVSQLDAYHRTKDEGDLKRVATLTLRKIDTLLDDLTGQKLAHQHEMRLLKSKLSSFIAVKKQKSGEGDAQDF
jgi:hypothetical protein